MFRKWTKIRRLAKTLRSEINRISYNEKVKLTNDVREVGPGKLGEIVGLVKSKCPTAFKDIDADNCQILVDYLDKEVIKMINLKLNEVSNGKRVKVK